MAKLGIMIEGQEGLTWERWRRIVETADQGGFDSVWRSDHLVSVMGKSERPTLALWPSLTAVAMWSDRLEFGQLVSPTTFRHPVHMTYDAIALDQLSNGRYHLGVGTGWNENEHRAFGFPLPPVGERMDRFEEALKVISLLMTGERTSFAGNHYQLDMAEVSARPTRESGVPLVIGGGGEKRTLRLVAEYADEWNVTPIGHDEYRHKNEVLSQHCADLGRDPSSITRSIMVGHIVGRDDAEIRKRAERLQEITGQQGGDIDEMLATRRGRGWLIGTPSAVIEQIKAREEQGLERFMLQTLDMDDIDALELIASDILPAVV